MCLQSPTTTAYAPTEIVRGWKVFEVRDKEILFPFFKIRPTDPRMAKKKVPLLLQEKVPTRGMWLKTNPAWERIFKYYPGFHFFLNLNTAKLWTLTYVRGLCHSAVIIPIRARNVHTAGSAWGFPCTVANEIYIPRKSKKEIHIDDASSFTPKSQSGHEGNPS